MERLKNLRIKKGLYQKDVAAVLGVDRTTYVKYENGDSEPSYDVLSKLADLFNVSVDYLLGRSNALSQPTKGALRIPVLGYVAAGIPIEAIEDILDYEELDPSEFDGNYKYFGLKIKGDSMMPRIQDGDVVIVRQQPDIESGDVAIVCVNGDEATCKQVKKHPEGISLIPYNNSYEVKFYTNKEIETLPITILGKVVELRGKF